MKKCPRCRELFDLSEFNKNSRRKDGLACHCRKCSKEVQRRSKAKRPEYYYVNNARRVDRDKAREYARATRDKHPGRDSARAKVYHAIRSGLIAPISTLVCVTCGAMAQEYHHMDYTKPLEVVALCRKCHREWHSFNMPKETERGVGVSAKLTWDDVTTIRALYATGQHSKRGLGRRFGVSESNIRAVICGKIWKQVG